MSEDVGLWIGFAFAVVATIFLFRIRSAAQYILHWPHVVARVVPGSILFRRAGPFPFGAERSLYIQEVHFEYERQGQSYKGCKLLPVGWTIRESERERVERELETFAVAFCNPSDPADAFLDIPDRFQRGSISWVTAGLVVAALISVVLGLVLLAKAA